MAPIEPNEPIEPKSDAVSTEPRGKNGLEVGFRARAGQIEIRFAECVDQCANHVCPTDGDAARRADVSAQTIEKYNLAVEQHDGHLRPVLGVRRAPSALLGS